MGPMNSVEDTAVRSGKSLCPRVFSSCCPIRPIEWGLWSPHDRVWMQILKDHYDIFHLGNCVQSRDGVAEVGTGYRIPRIIHHIWLGSSLPPIFCELRRSWEAMHADWRLRLWTDEDVHGLQLRNREAYDAASNFGEKSDILRYEILFAEGGLYVDVDFLCFGNFESLHKTYDFFTGVSNTGTFELNNGLIGCCAGHPILNNVIQRIAKTKASNPALESVSALSGLDEAGSLPISVGAAGKSQLAGLLGEMEGALGSLLGDSEHVNLTKALKVEDRTSTSTIISTGPGVFTVAVMELVSSRLECGRGLDHDTKTDKKVTVESTEVTTRRVSRCTLDNTEGNNGLGRVMVFPPAFFYPIPNNAPGDMVGEEGGIAMILAKCKGFLQEESLAAHLWARSWQQKFGHELERDRRKDRGTE
ncbi:unnamed protein product [Choristocarpus tenellus]